MKLELNIEKKHLVFFGVFLLLVLGGYVVADGWDSSKPFHETLFVDILTSKTDVNPVQVNDNLKVTGNLEVVGDCINCGSSGGTPTGNFLVYNIPSTNTDVYYGILTEENLAVGYSVQIDDGENAVPCEENEYLYGMDYDISGGYDARIYCKKINSPAFSLGAEVDCNGEVSGTACVVNDDADCPEGSLVYKYDISNGETGIDKIYCKALPQYASLYNCHNTDNLEEPRCPEGYFVNGVHEMGWTNARLRCCAIKLDGAFIDN